jgi:hypothetical protein
VLVLARVLTPAVLAVLSVAVIAVLVATLVVILIVAHPCRRPCRPRHGAFYKKPERDTSMGRNGRLLTKIAGKRSYARKYKSRRMALLPTLRSMAWATPNRYSCLKLVPANSRIFARISAHNLTGTVRRSPQGMDSATHAQLLKKRYALALVES